MTLVLFALSTVVTFVCVTILWTIIGANFVNRNYEVAGRHGIVLGGVVAVIAPLLIALVTQSWEATVMYSTFISIGATIPIGCLVVLIAVTKIIR